MGENEIRSQEGGTPETWSDISQEDYERLVGLVDETVELTLDTTKQKELGFSGLLRKYREIGDMVHKLAKMPGRSLDTQELILGAKVVGFTAKSQREIQRTTSGLVEGSEKNNTERLIQMVAVKAYVAKKRR